MIPTAGLTTGGIPQNVDTGTNYTTTTDGSSATEVSGLSESPLSTSTRSTSNEPYVDLEHRLGTLTTEGNFEQLLHQIDIELAKAELQETADTDSVASEEEFQDLLALRV